MPFYYDEDDSDDDYEDDEFVPRLVVDVVDSDIKEDADDLTCFKCPRVQFPSADALRRHKVQNPKTHDYCALCDIDFDNYKAKELHLLNSDKHITCCVCTTEFKSDGGLAIHMKQNHKNKQPGKCPACGERYTTQSGLLQHIEGNLCTGGLRRSAIHNAILTQQATAGFESLGLGTAEGSEIDSRGPASGNLSPNVALQLAKQVDQMTDSSTPDARRGIRLLETKVDMPIIADTMVNIKDEWFDLKARRWRCPYKGCTKNYVQLNSFEQHINSPTHQTKDFRCPGCLDRFASSSAILQHVESESCRVSNTANIELVKRNLTTKILESQPTTVSSGNGVSRGSGSAAMANFKANDAARRIAHAKKNALAAQQAQNKASKQVIESSD